VELRNWYFEHRQHQALPENLIYHIRELGFETVQDFDRALWRERIYLQSFDDLASNETRGKHCNAL
jgi:hypothetical protein